MIISVKNWPDCSKNKFVCFFSEQIENLQQRILQLEQLLGQHQNENLAQPQAPAGQQPEGQEPVLPQPGQQQPGQPHQVQPVVEPPMENLPRPVAQEQAGINRQCEYFCYLWFF